MKDEQSLNIKLNEYNILINEALEQFLLDDGEIITEAMRYSLFAGGKRIRPIITLEICKLCGGDFHKAIPFACAIEMIHSYSLIYDDLPCMDNDVLRRGKQTNHVIYGEDMALMAGAGLYAEAFDIILDNYKKFNLTDAQLIEGFSVLTKASGRKGIVTGQVLDMGNIKEKVIDRNVLERIYSYKTGAMLQASALLGCIAADADDEKKKNSVEFAKNLGLAFQIRDDILDVTGNENKLGKSIGKDKADIKRTFVDIMGLQDAQYHVEQFSSLAKEYLNIFNNNAFLIDLTDKMCNRDK